MRPATRGRRAAPLAALALAALAPAAAGCYAPRIGDGDLACSDAGLCPRGFRCGVLGRCWRNPDAAAADAATDGAAAAAEAGDRLAGTDASSAVDGSSAADVAGAADAAGAADLADAGRDTVAPAADAAGDAAAARDATAVADGGAIDAGHDATAAVDRGAPEPPRDAAPEASVDAGARPDAAPPDAPKKGLGASCGGPSECDSDLCVDRVCCDAACSGQCEACDTANALGRCTAVASATPPGGRPPCDGAGTCAGSCDGVTRATCSYPGITVTCSGACPTTGLSVPGLCDGRGGCALSLQLCF